ncbi:MAG: tRNA(Met) cytidine acetyltransferase [Thermoprotei archaeon]|nr:MAG: tRNA(Met) cytidine acetyltransferase [Thermoprotei archaeon]
MLPKKAIKHCLRSMRDAIRENHRRIVVLTGSDDDELAKCAAQLVEEYMKEYGTSDKELAYVYHAFYEDGVKRKEVFKKTLGKEFSVDYIPYHEIRKILGLTYDIAVLDLINNLEPNDIGRLSGIVRGGGFYIFIMARLSDYEKIITRFQRTLLTPQYKIEDIRHIFSRRFIRKLFEHDGIAIYDIDEKKFLKRFKIKRKYRKVEYTGKPFEIPPKTRLPRKAYELALTADQVEVLRLLEELYEKPRKGEGIAIVITADRGRGKSSVVGIGLAALAHKLRKAKGRTRIIVTAPNEYNVQPLFMLAKKTLEELKHSLTITEKDGVITALKSKGIEIEYYNPLEASRRKADIVAVDEAAGLQVPMLFNIMNRFDRVIFSSTIHGYEGAGRGFSVRFLGRLKKMENIRVYEYEMEQPIRFSENDPIEKWAFDTLLLDAEPAVLTREDDKYIERLNVSYYKPELEEFFLEKEEELRQFIGIYIMAHYRNNPNDLGMMMDAPHHTVRALKLPNGKIVASLEIAEEGPLLDELAKESARGAWIAGNIIPDRVIKHYKLLDFGKFKGWRIVRIAVHPSAMGRGLGSKLLSELEKEAIDAGYDWVGAGFGVTEELLNFWIKNGYIPVHISPDRNPVSGEYTILVIKPLNDEAKKYISYIAREFKKKLLDCLYEPYHDLDPEVALMLLNSTPPISDIEIGLSKPQLGRFMSYAWSDLTLESCMDCMVKIAKYYFASPNRPSLTRLQELLLVTRILQGKSWRMVCEELDLNPPDVMFEIKNIAKKLSEFYFNIKGGDEIERYIFLNLNDLVTINYSGENTRTQ